MGKDLGGYLVHSFDRLSSVARNMLAAPPYHIWPLHVKLFTEEAKTFWEIQRPGLEEPLPQGFTCSVEYEGADGKSPVPASRPSDSRLGSMDIKDSMPESIEVLLLLIKPHS